MRWRARASLRDEKWQRLLDDIAEMAQQEREREEWKYWEAIALLRSGKPFEGHGALLALSEERSYHGFLAADELGREYSLENALRGISIPIHQGAQKYFLEQKILENGEYLKPKGAPDTPLRYSRTLRVDSTDK